MIGHDPEVIRNPLAHDRGRALPRGAPEDLVLNGAFEATFAGAELDSDRESGGL